MTKILVLYYSSYGHIERMAEADSEGLLVVARGNPFLAGFDPDL